MAKKVEIYGGFGEEFDDGVYDSVRKVCVGVYGDRVSSVEFEYGKGDQSIIRSHGQKSQESKEFVLDHARGEYIKSVEVTSHGNGLISSLTFITSVERDREVFGKVEGTKNFLEAKGFDKLVGFRGRSYLDRLNALGAHFAVVLTPPVKKLEAKGGNFGDEWDDGVHDNVRKITIRRSEGSVEMVKFKYVNGTEIVLGDAHGDTSQLPYVKEKFVLSEDEYLTFVHGHYGQKFPVGQSVNLHGRFCDGITMLKFKTNKDTYQVLGAETEGYEYVGTSFVLGETDHKIVGKTMAKKVGIYGGIGEEFDDGVYDSVRKVCVGVDGDRVSSVEFEYGKGDQTITLSHGKKSSQERKEFVLDHDEYIKSVEGTFHHYYFISSLTFITSVERDREVFGKEVGTKFVLKAKGFDKLVGFRGRSSLDRLNALGAHFAVVLTPPVKKLESKGGNNFRNEWDDGIHDNVRKIKVKRYQESVEIVQFKYVNGTEIVLGDAHGFTSQPSMVKEKFVLSEDEYITSVHGHYGQKIPVGQSFNLHARYCNGITMLKFKTNKDTYQVLGAETEGYEYVGTSFVLGETGHKIVGFHGKSSTFSLAQIGVYVSPINNA
ncbi:unnamed protein product [Arabidopsis arenosa]|uniref:Jacalin-type lectin domain-containing protein n=1 Tax=Arabidopsis arenosa TaxID=38785 RepID=A0A8S2AVP8_ARAAE|nr:unnamed protein product [Arabidopsis arenosa]